MKMAVDHDTSASILANKSSIKETKICKNHVSRKKSKSYYICLGALVQMVQTQVQNKYAQNNHLYLVGSKYIKDLYNWVYQCKFKQTFIDEFLQSFITSIALFAVGIKLTNELVAWKIF